MQNRHKPIRLRSDRPRADVFSQARRRILIEQVFGRSGEAGKLLRGQSPSGVELTSNHLTIQSGHAKRIVRGWKSGISSTSRTESLFDLRRLQRKHAKAKIIGVVGAAERNGHDMIDREPRKLPTLGRMTIFAKKLCSFYDQISYLIRDLRRQAISLLTGWTCGLIYLRD